MSARKCTVRSGAACDRPRLQEVKEAWYRSNPAYEPEEHPMTPFFEADLRGEVFQCLIGPSGPMVIGDGGGVCLGVCALRNLADLQWRRRGQIEIADEVGQPTWCIVK